MACELRQIACITGPVRGFDVCAGCSELEYSYSADGAVWSDWLGKEDFLRQATAIDGDYFLRLRLYGNPEKITVDGEQADFTLSLAPSFDFTPAAPLYDPYANLDCAMKLYQSLTESVSNIVGIPCWYFKVAGDEEAKDITFKEYCHLRVASVKYIKIIVADGSMPSSKPDFDDFGISWTTDWETEISKATFATAFSSAAQPQEGDLVYIPMMKRMWQVQSAYEEKKDGFMWNATTFRVFLRKYESADALSTEGFESQISSVIKNTYDDLFAPAPSASTDTLSAPSAALPKPNAYQVWDRDAYRREIAADDLIIREDPVYCRGAVVGDNWYAGPVDVVYQKSLCSCDGAVSFLVKNNGGAGEISWGDNCIIKKGNKIFFGEIELEIGEGAWLAWVRWSSSLKIVEGCAAPLRLPPEIPLYRARAGLWRLDTDNASKSSALYGAELARGGTGEFKSDGTDWYTSIKFWDSYAAPADLIMQYPNSDHLLINDTARPLADGPGYPIYASNY